MPTFQDSIYEVFSDDDVEMIALNLDANPTALLSYRNYTGPLGSYFKADTIRYPIVYDSTLNSSKGATFAAYGASSSLLWPAIFVVDQQDFIRLDFYAAGDPIEFQAHLTELINKINELLENPP